MKLVGGWKPQVICVEHDNRLVELMGGRRSWGTGCTTAMAVTPFWSGNDDLPGDRQRKFLPRGPRLQNERPISTSAKVRPVGLTSADHAGPTTLGLRPERSEGNEALIRILAV